MLIRMPMQTLIGLEYKGDETLQYTRIAIHNYVVQVCRIKREAKFIVSNQLGLLLMTSRVMINMKCYN